MDILLKIGILLKNARENLKYETKFERERDKIEYHHRHSNG